MVRVVRVVLVARAASKAASPAAKSDKSKGKSEAPAAPAIPPMNSYLPKPSSPPTVYRLPPGGQGAVAVKVVSSGLWGAVGVCAWGLCWESVLGVWGVCLGMVDGGAVLPRGLTVLPFLAFITEL